jgi:hypothetical protein
VINQVAQAELTQFQMLLRAVHELSYPSCKTLRDNKVFTAERVLADEEAENFDEMRVQ